MLLYCVHRELVVMSSSSSSSCSSVSSVSSSRSSAPLTSIVPLTATQIRLIYDTVLRVHTDHVASRPDSPLSEVVSTNAILLALASQNIRISASQLNSMTAEAKSKNRKIKNSAKGKENRRSKAQETHNTVLQQYEVQMAGKRTRYQRSTVPLPPEPKIFRGRLHVPCLT
jgi:hypothetical protein